MEPSDISPADALAAARQHVMNARKDASGYRSFRLFRATVDEGLSEGIRILKHAAKTHRHEPVLHLQAAAWTIQRPLLDPLVKADSVADGIGILLSRTPDPRAIPATGVRERLLIERATEFLVINGHANEAIMLLDFLEGQQIAANADERARTRTGAIQQAVIETERTAAGVTAYARRISQTDLHAGLSPATQYDTKESIFVSLQQVTGICMQDGIGHGMQKLDRIIDKFPNEPVLRLRRVDLLTQTHGENLEQEYRSGIAALQSLLGVKPIFSLQGRREKNMFYHAQRQFGAFGWNGLKETTIAVAKGYYPDFGHYCGQRAADTPVRAPAALHSAALPPSILKR